MPGGIEVKWFRGSGYSVRGEGEEKVLAWQPKLPASHWAGKYGEETPVTALPPKDRAKWRAAVNGPGVYTLEEGNLPGFCSSLLNAIDEESIVNHVQHYGLLGLLWAYREEGTQVVDTRLSVSSFPLGGMPLQLFLGTPPQELTRELMQRYGESLPLFLDAVNRFRSFATACLQGHQPKATLAAPVTIHYSAKGNPYWLPKAVTPLEMAYVHLPMLLAEGWPLRLCNCGRFFQHNKKVRCPSCDQVNNAEKQRKVRQMQKACRYVILRGIEVGEAAKQSGVSQERLLARLEDYVMMDAMDVGARINSTRYEAIEDWQEKFYHQARG